MGIVVPLLACALAAGWYSARTIVGLDYDTDAGPAVAALARGDLDGYFGAQPLLGSFSVLFRAPAAALAGADELLAYRLGSFVCLLAAGLLAVALERLMARRGQPAAARAIAAGIVLVNPVTADALAYGHPEELLGAALAVGALVAALEGVPLAAGLLLGLALATKQWALLAVLPVLLAAPDRRLRLVLVAGAVAAALTVPHVLANPETFAGGTRSAAGLDHLAGERVTALNVWYPFAEPRRIGATDGFGPVIVEKRSLPIAFVGATHIGIVLLAIPLAALWWRRRDRLQPVDALGLLALLFLLRCMLDPWDNQYYHAPFLTALGAWEGLRRRGLPVATMLIATAMWLSFDRLAPPSGAGITTALYLAWAVPAAAYLAAEVYAPATMRSFGKLLRTSAPSSLTTTRSSIRTPKAPAT